VVMFVTMLFFFVFFVMALVFAAVLFSLILMFPYNHPLPLDYPDLWRGRRLRGADLHPYVGSCNVNAYCC